MLFTYFLNLHPESSESDASKVEYAARGEYGATSDCIVQFRVWSIGRLVQEDLAACLRGVCSNALWDLHTEYSVLPLGHG